MLLKKRDNLLIQIYYKKLLQKKERKIKTKLFFKIKFKITHNNRML